ncbi:3-deoxy-manno-octulosonate cytidylyltransferase [Candidatus Marinimicrobia bacterium]|nr:3-deoxy-manno-octulosonate cytidylyltransferase [Candidatus Neomarinimicrobiota bacterium]
MDRKEELIVVIGIIPARLQSIRFPNKILTPIDEKPMVMHVYDRARKSEKLDDVIIAIDSNETEDALKQYKPNIVMTHPDHPSGTDRVAEVAKDIDVDIILNIQGDEPMLDPIIIDELVSCFDDELVEMATIGSRVIDNSDYLNPNSVKMMINENGFATSFSREIKDYQIGGYYHHVGIYGYRKDTLLRFTSLNQSVNEKNSNLEQLRALDNGIPIKVAMTDYPHRGIDTKEDLQYIQSTK